MILPAAIGAVGLLAGSKLLGDKLGGNEKPRFDAPDLDPMTQALIKKQNEKALSGENINAEQADFVRSQDEARRLSADAFERQKERANAMGGDYSKIIGDALERKHSKATENYLARQLRDQEYGLDARKNQERMNALKTQRAVERQYQANMQGYMQQQAAEAQSRNSAISSIIGGVGSLAGGVLGGIIGSSTEAKNTKPNTGGIA